MKLKIIVDQIKDVQVIVSGSSSLDINNATQEPLTGRKLSFICFPFHGRNLKIVWVTLKRNNNLKFDYCNGMYPDVINNFGTEYEILKNLVSSYLYKDILALAGIRKSEVLEKILRALAMQVGSEVSYNEIAPVGWG